MIFLIKRDYLTGTGFQAGARFNIWAGKVFVYRPFFKVNAVFIGCRRVNFFLVKANGFVIVGHKDLPKGCFAVMAFY